MDLLLLEENIKDERGAALCMESPLAVQREDSAFGMKETESRIERLQLPHTDCEHDQWDFNWADEVEVNDQQPQHQAPMMDAMNRRIEALEIQVEGLLRERENFASRLIMMAEAKIRLCQESDHYQQETWKGKNLAEQTGKARKPQRPQSVTKKASPRIFAYGKMKYVPHTYDYKRGQNSPRGSGSNLRVVPEKVICTFCKKPGHIGRVCRKRKKYRKEQMSKTP